jgi:hypothetical protein
VSFKIKSRISRDLIEEGIKVQMASGIPLGIYLVPNELKTLAVQEIKFGVEIQNVAPKKLRRKKTPI